MIICKLVVLLWCLGDNFTTADGQYLHFATPNRELESAQDGHNPKIGGKLSKKGIHHKKLVILDRRHKAVDKFVKKLMSVIEVNDREKLMNKRKRPCRHASFGSIYDSRTHRRRCKKSPVYRKISWINFVIPVSVRKQLDVPQVSRDSFSDDYLSDFFRKDTDFDYFNLVNRAKDLEAKQKAKTPDKIKQNLPKSVLVNGNSIITIHPSRRDHTRFKIVPNKYSSESESERGKEKNTQSDKGDSDKADSDNTDNSEDSDENKNEPSKSDSDSNEPQKEPARSKQPMKKIKDEWNDILNMPDLRPDSSEESSPPKRKQKNNHDSDSSDNGSESDASEKDNHEYENKDGNEDEKYVYMQAHRLYNVKDGRRMRDRNYFLPKRHYWTEDTINHLGPYWNSHEISGINTM